MATSTPRPPVKVRHHWTFDNSRKVWVCDACQGWTANLDEYRYGVCAEKDRRSGKDRRSEP